MFDTPTIPLPLESQLSSARGLLHQISMKVRWIPKTTVVCLAMVLSSACIGPSNTAQTVRDLQLIKSSVEENRAESASDILNLLSRISQGTLDFIGQGGTLKAVETASTPVQALNEFISANPRVVELRHRIRRGSVLFNEAELDAIGFSGLASEETSLLTQERHNLIREHRVVFGDGKLYDKVYCENECQCTSRALGEVLKSAQAGPKVLYLTVQPKKPQDRIEVISGSEAKPLWDYHVALLISDAHAGWGVVDPILYGDTQARSFSIWSDRLGHSSELNYLVSVEVSKFLLDR
jgi:hypothetical protein